MSTTVTVVEANSWWEQTPARRAALREWMRANDIPADFVPTQEEIVVVGDKIHYTELVLDENRQPIYKDGLVTCQEIIAPLKQEIPAALTTFRS